MHRVCRPLKKRGAAVAELAVTLPVPLLFLLGTIDAGQFANVYQTVSNASLEGARVASKSTTTSSDDVRAAVVTHLDNAITNISASELNAVLSVSISNLSNGQVLDDSLAGIPAGTKLEVQVSLPYSAVRFISGLNVLNAKTVQMSTVIRRQ
ncbi:MAG: pilus assembly protein [bacterium]|nr:pilus assembly protein [bacterium]